MNFRSNFMLMLHMKFGFGFGFGFDWPRGFRVDLWTTDGRTDGRRSMTIL